MFWDSALLFVGLAAGVGICWLVGLRRAGHKWPARWGFGGATLDGSGRTLSAGFRALFSRPQGEGSRLRVAESARAFFLGAAGFALSPILLLVGFVTALKAIDYLAAALAAVGYCAMMGALLFGEVFFVMVDPETSPGVEP